MNNQLTVSLCVIAKDEEQFIRQCLRCVAHIVHESIVVDTGSSDKTVNIAREEGAKVFTFTWCGDFAAARNFALAQAASDWILVLDADEVLESISREDFDGLIATPGVEGYFVKIISYVGNGTDTMDDYVVRLFRNKAAYRFQGAIHEQVAGSIKEENGGEGLAFSPLTIAHYGYLDRQIIAKAKRCRNTAIIRQALLTMPQDPFLLYSLGIEYLQNGQFLCASSNLEKSLKLMLGHEGYFRNAVISFGVCLYKTDQLHQLFLLVSECLRMFPGDADLYALQGIALLSTGNYLEAVTTLEKALAGNGELFSPNWLYALLGDAYNLSGFYTRAGEEYIKALRINPRILYPLAQLLGLRQRGQFVVDWGSLNTLNLPVSLIPSSKDGEDVLSLVLILLKMLGCCSAEQYKQLPGLYPYLADILLTYSNKNSKKFIVDYFKVWEAELMTHLEATAKFAGCDLFCPLSKALDLIIFTLELVSRTLCPSWSPEPSSYLL